VLCLFYWLGGALSILLQILWKLVEKKFRDLGEFVEGKDNLNIVVHNYYEDEVSAIRRLFSEEDQTLAIGEVSACTILPLTSLGNLADDDGIIHDIEELAMEGETLCKESNEFEDDDTILGQSEAKPWKSPKRKEFQAQTPIDLISLSDDEDLIDCACQNNETLN